MRISLTWAATYSLKRKPAHADRPQDEVRISVTRSSTLRCSAMASSTHFFSDVDFRQSRKGARTPEKFTRTRGKQQ